MQRPRQLEYSKPVQLQDNWIDLNDPVKQPKTDPAQKIIIPDMFITLAEEDAIPTKKCSYAQYTKVTKSGHIPSDIGYEPDNKDLTFLNELNLKRKDRLSSEAFCEIIRHFECQAQNVESVCQYQNINEIHEYWQTKITLNKRYLLRRFMHPAAEDQNANLAFRPREKDKMRLRRNVRGNDQDTLVKLKVLKKEMQTSYYVVQNILLRDQYKHYVTLLEFLSKRIILEYDEELQKKYDMGEIQENCQNIQIKFKKLQKELATFIIEQKPKPPVQTIPKPQPIVEEKPIKEPIIKVQPPPIIQPIQIEKPEPLPIVLPSQKNLLLYKIRALKLQKRVCVERYLEEEDEFSEEYYGEWREQVQEDEEEMVEAAKQIRRVMQYGFKNFLKQKRAQMSQQIFLDQ